MTLLSQLIELRLLGQREKLMIQFVLERTPMFEFDPTLMQSDISLFLTILCYENSLGRVRLKWSEESFKRIFNSIEEEFHATNEYQNYKFSREDIQEHQKVFLNLEESEVVQGLGETVFEGEMNLQKFDFETSPTIICKIQEQDNTYYYFQKNYHAEIEILKGIDSLLERNLSELKSEEEIDSVAALKEVFAAPFILPIDKVTGEHFKFHERQVLAAYLASQSPFFIISGGPGTGKTSVLVQVLRTLLRTNPSLNSQDIALCAPTGRAKARMGESLANSLAPLNEDGGRGDIVRDLTLKDCQSNSFTLHSLLGKQLRGDKSKLNFKLIVIDEFSMVDVHLFALLIKSLPADCRLILLGDMHQLPPVGHGSVLGDLSKGFTQSKATLSEDLYKKITDEISDIDLEKSDAEYQMTSTLTHKLLDKIIVLTKSQRSAEHILHLAKAANDGQVDQAKSLLVNCKGSLDQVEYLDSTVHKVNDTVKSFLKSHLNDNWKSVLRKLKSDYKNQALPSIITSTQNSELFSMMSTIFQAHHNMRILCLGHQGPSGTISLNKLARELLDSKVKDPANRIHGELVMVTRNQNDIGLFNGDAGIVINCAGHKYVVFPLENTFRVEPLERIHHLDSAFAISVHKSQGSEYVEIFMALPDRKSKLLTREILYTGITRAKKKAIIHGSVELFGEGVTRFVDRPSALSTWLEL